MTKQRYITCIYDKIRSKLPPNRETSPTCLHCDVTHLSLTTGVVALHIPSRRVWVREEHRQARKTVWPVNAGRVICRYQNNLCGIINHHKHIWECFCDVLFAGLSIITMNHIDTGTKTAAGTRSPLWRRRLLDAGSCSFTHPAVRDNHYSFAPKIHAVMLLFPTMHDSPSLASELVVFVDCDHNGWNNTVDAIWLIIKKTYVSVAASGYFHL